MPHWLRWSILFAVACSHAAAPTGTAPTAAAETAAHREQVAAQVKPLLDAELVSGLVVGLYDAGKTEVYGFGAGPNHAPPDGATLFELGPITKVYTSLLLADAVQRREVGLDTPLAELLPLGVTVPIRDNVTVTLKHLALHSAGFPRLPPSLVGRAADPDPYARYGEDALYKDLIRTELESTPGTQINYSNYGSGVLGFALGRKLGGGYAKQLTERVLRPLGLTQTYLTVPVAAAAQRALGTDEDLAPAAPWTFDALAGSAGLVSSAHDQLQLIAAELDATAGGALPLRRAMKLSQEPQLERTGDNEALGWMIDSAGRYWHNGGTGGFHAYLGFDPKTRRGLVVLASTSTALVDRLVDAMYKVLDGKPPAPIRLADAATLATFAGTYELSGTKLEIVAVGKRLYLEGPGDPRHRLSPISDHQVWLEALQSIAAFEKEGDRVVRVLFGIGDHTLVAPRVDPAPPPAKP
jgi:D-alanyl-D-alanine-carboxypeptidase/D-alanyl-D-alanine-endopeptidase